MHLRIQMFVALKFQYSERILLFFGENELLIWLYWDTVEKNLQQWSRESIYSELEEFKWVEQEFKLSETKISREINTFLTHLHYKLQNLHSLHTNLHNSLTEYFTYARKLFLSFSKISFLIFG